MGHVGRSEFGGGGSGRNYAPSASQESPPGQELTLPTNTDACTCDGAASEGAPHRHVASGLNPPTQVRKLPSFEE
jgi:hypothetical protein